jgi:signal transduction histidine kinase
MVKKERKKRVDRLAFLGTLAGGLAHEVKNPLSTMSVNLQLLREDWEDAETPREKRTLKRVDILLREIAQLESIVNDFLRFARGFSLEPVLTDVNALVRELIEFLNPEALRLKIHLRTSLDPALPMVLLDRKYIQKALMNLIHNAFQALAAQEEAKREVLVRTRPRAGGVEVELIDTGPGIAPDHQEKVFQVFFSTKKGGTGMGLPTVRRIVEEHDGTLAMHSEEGKGTSFVLFFPGPEKEGTGV